MSIPTVQPPTFNSVGGDLKNLDNAEFADVFDDFSFLPDNFDNSDLDEDDEDVSGNAKGFKKRKQGEGTAGLTKEEQIEKR